MKESKVLLTPKEVSKEFNMNLNYVYSLISRKKITSEYLKSGQMVIDKDSVTHYFETSVRRPGAGKRVRKYVRKVKVTPEVKAPVKAVKVNKERSMIIDFVSLVLATVLGAILGSLLITTIIK
jgi:hypothetical protein